MMNRNRRVVYSTDGGRHCPDCGQPVDHCRCAERAARAVAPGDGIVRLQRQTKGRAGKPVVVISGLALPPDRLEQVARTLKSKCGVGGTVKDGNVVIQGDKRDRIRAELASMGYRVKG